jgi:hypothetical protein
MEVKKTTFDCGIPSEYGRYLLVAFLKILASIGETPEGGSLLRE